MASKVGTVKFVDRRNCFVTLSNNLSAVYGQFLRGKKFVILTLDFGEKHILTTWHGDTTRGNGDCVEISGLYANKLGIKDGAQVVISVTRHLPTCTSVLVEPVSVDDWEILELHAAYIESHLLDQTRIVWNGEVLPIWLQGNVCVFVYISEIQPRHQCTLLQIDTQVVVVPNERKNKKPTGPLRKNGSVNGHHSELNEMDKSDPPDSPHVEGCLPCLPDSTNQLSVSSSETYDNLSFFSRMRNGLSWLLTDTPYAPSLREEVVSHVLGLNVETSLRVQAFFQSLLLEPLRPRFDSKNPKSRSPPPISSPLSIHSTDQSPEHLALSQPNTMCISCETLQQQCQLDLKSGDMFLAVIYKLWSPKEEVDRKKLSVRNNSNSSSGSSGGDSPPLTNVVDVAPTVVRVVALDRCCERGIVLDGHVMVQDFMRQSLHLDVTGRVVMKSVNRTNAGIRSLALVPDYGGRAKLDEQVIWMAFRHWLSQCTSLQCPLVVNDGMVVNVPLTNNTLVTCQLSIVFDTPYGDGGATVESSATAPPFGLICGEIIDDIATRVANCKSQTKRRTSTKTLNELDPKIPTLDVKRLGGITTSLDSAVQYIDFCLAMKPLAAELLSENVRCRGLLISGEKGVGKSSFCKMLCDHFTSVPHLAFTNVIDCKTLRGKTIESIHNCLIRAYEEAKWRQPSILILDDLDLIAAACTSPEQELSGEAMYYSRVAEVMKELLKTIVYNRCQMVVVGVCKSRKAIHPSLVTSRGQHYFENTVNIDRPNLDERNEILRSLMEATPMIDPQTLRTLDVDLLCKKMDGYVAKDIRRLLDRAIHANLKSSDTSVSNLTNAISQIRTKGRGQKQANQSVRLRMTDFDSALENFTTLSLRDVSLHRVEDEISWDDVGGLQDVKTTLQETLLWPMKYPELFKDAPLRLRTGMLLFGPPGTGKTLLARAVAKECGLNFISIKGPELLNKYIGASEQAVRDTFMRAHNAKPCILFFDEFDSLAPRRGHDSTGVTDRVVNQFLTQLDGFEALEGVYVLAATSRPDMIDPALLRPGRLDKCIYCPMPDLEERLEILRSLSKRLSLADDVNLDVVGDLADHFTGADLKALLYNAQLTAVHRQLDAVKTRNKVSKDLEEKLAKYVTQLSDNSEGFDTGICDMDIETDSSDLASSLGRGESLFPGHPDIKHPQFKLLTKSRESSVDSDDIADSRSSSLCDVSPQSTTPSDRLSMSSGSLSNMKPTVVTQDDLIAALEAMAPSVPVQERRRYEQVADEPDELADT